MPPGCYGPSWRRRAPSAHVPTGSWLHSCIEQGTGWSPWTGSMLLRAPDQEAPLVRGQVSAAPRPRPRRSAGCTRRGGRPPQGSKDKRAGAAAPHSSTKGPPDRGQPAVQSLSDGISPGPLDGPRCRKLPGHVCHKAVPVPGRLGEAIRRTASQETTSVRFSYTALRTFAKPSEGANFCRDGGSDAGHARQPLPGSVPAGLPECEVPHRVACRTESGCAVDTLATPWPPPGSSRPNRMLFPSTGGPPVCRSTRVGDRDRGVLPAVARSEPQMGLPCGQAVAAARRWSPVSLRAAAAPKVRLDQG